MDAFWVFFSPILCTYGYKLLLALNRNSLTTFFGGAVKLRGGGIVYCHPLWEKSPQKASKYSAMPPFECSTNHIQQMAEGGPVVHTYLQPPDCLQLVNLPQRHVTFRSCAR